MKNFTFKTLSIWQHCLIAAFLISGMTYNNLATAQFTLPTNTAPQATFSNWYYPSGLISDAVDPQDPANPVFKLENAGWAEANIVSPAIPISTTIDHVLIWIKFKTKIAINSITGSNQVRLFYYLSDTLIDNSQINWQSQPIEHSVLGGIVNYFPDRWTDNDAPLYVDFKAGQYLYIMISGNTGFPFYVDDITISSTAGATALPIDFAQALAATINYSSRAIDLTWATATETNNKGFNIERSQDGGQTWSTLGFTPSQAVHNNSNTTIYYSYSDLHPHTGNNTYRLKLIELDGSIKYSNTTSQVFHPASQQPAIFPNPITGSQLQIKNAPANCNYKIIDMSGRVILTGKLVSGKSIHVGHLRAGIYYIQLKGQNGTEQSLKFIK